MKQIDPKKVEYSQERHEIAQDIVDVRNLRTISLKVKDQLIGHLLDKKNKTQTDFSLEKRYKEVLNKLSEKQRKEMRKNIRITSDNKIEVVEMGKKFSVMMATPNGVDIIDQDFKDQYGHSPKDFGIKAVYFNMNGIKRECEKQNKSLLRNREEVEKFVNFFPGDTLKEKISNLRILFDLGNVFGYYMFDANPKSKFDKRILKYQSGVISFGVMLAEMNGIFNDEVGNMGFDFFPYIVNEPV